MNNHFSEIKLWLISTSAIAFSLTGFQDWLKVIVLVLTVGYTARKWWKMENNKNKE